VGPWRWRVKKFGPVPLSFILSISVSAEYNIKLRKYTADVASALRICLSALVCFTPQTLQVWCSPCLRLCKCTAVNHEFRPDRTALAKSEEGPHCTCIVWGVDSIALAKPDAGLQRSWKIWGRARIVLAKFEAGPAAYLQSLRWVSRVLAGSSGYVYNRGQAGKLWFCPSTSPRSEPCSFTLYTIRIQRAKAKTWNRLTFLRYKN